MFVVGTAGVVYPAASLPYIAKDNGAKIIEINPEPTPITDIADVFLPGYSGHVLPQIVTAFKKITRSHP
jgi:NAD-dependent deacetylase